MKNLSFVYLIAMPYLIIGALVFMVKHEVTGTSFLLFLIASILLCMIGVGACVVCNLASLTIMKDSSSAIRNLIIKFCYLPAHLLVLLIVGGFMNPFLIWASWIPAMCGVGLLMYSAFTNIGACVTLVRRKKCSLKTAVILGLLSFVYVADIVAGFVQLKKAFGKEVLS